MLMAKLCLLLYADAIVLISDSEAKLQNMLDTMIVYSHGVMTMILLYIWIKAKLYTSEEVPKLPKLITTLLLVMLL